MKRKTVFIVLRLSVPSKMRVSEIEQFVKSAIENEPDSTRDVVLARNRVEVFHP